MVVNVTKRATVQKVIKHHNGRCFQTPVSFLIKSHAWVFSNPSKNSRTMCKLCFSAHRFCYSEKSKSSEEKKPHSRWKEEGSISNTLAGVNDMCQKNKTYLKKSNKLSKIIDDSILKKLKQESLLNSSIFTLKLVPAIFIKFYFFTKW